MKQPVISLMLYKSSTFLVDSIPTKIKLPEGCVGIMFVFESKKAARKFNKKAELVEIET